ncbi:MAG: ParB/RepB/Spo0J family partition protein [Gemmataceae bacterium]
MNNQKPTTELRLLDWFKTDPKELARHDDPEKIRHQGEDMLANGQLQAVGATEDGRMIFGHGRWLAAKAVGIKTLEVKLFPASLSDTRFKLIRAAENLQRKELTGYQKWLLCADLISGNAAWQMKELAEHLHLDPSMVTRLLSPSKCIEAVQNALRDGKIGISDCYAISKLPSDEQAGLLALKLSGATRDQIEQAGRKSRITTTTAVKLARVRCPLSNGATVVISGPEMSLADVIEALGQALDAAKKANKESLDVKTAEKVWKDKAKAG